MTRRATRRAKPSSPAYHVPTVTIERQLEQPPVTVRSELEPLGDGRVRIVRYLRRRRHAARFERVRAMEGRVVSFEQLHVGRSYGEVFPQAGLFDGADEAS